MTYILKPYDDTLEYILRNGERKSNRTGIDTFSIFGMQSRYKIDEYFPIVTRRKMFPKSIFAELLWMLSGSTDINKLEKLESKIWTPWRDKEFEKRNSYNDGELGPIYGFLMRHFGGLYKDDDFGSMRNFRPAGGGFDQIAYIVNELKNNKTSRRILMNLWDPQVVTTDQVRLPPCHYSFQLSVDNQDRLSGLLCQRSADAMLGSPANIQFYSAFIYMLAQQCNLTPYELVYSTADTHIYENQIPMIEEYLSRPIVDSPKLELNKAKDIDSYTLEDFKVIDYNPLEKIIVPIAV